MSFLWKLEASPDSPSLLDCEFQTSFNVKESSTTEGNSSYVYDFQVENSQTLFTVQSRMEPAEDSQDLVVGTMCNLCITFINTSADSGESATQVCREPLHHDLLYEVEVESNAWMISGRNKGVISIPSVAMATCSVTLGVMPLTGGYLPLPHVKLLKYDNRGETEKDKDSESKDSVKGTKPTADSPEQKPVKPASSRAPPVVTPFLCGQVYNSTQATQVRVLPSNQPN